MSYLDEFRLLIEEGKLNNFFKLWEEYCMIDEVDGQELKQILQMVKVSTLALTFGQFVETALPLWKKIPKEADANSVIKLILDLQTTQSPLLADLASEYLKKRYGNEKNFNEKLRIIGLLTRHSFQGAISNYELLSHMDKGKFVFHTGGWGVGEVMEISLLREHVLLEFEGITALKDLSFDNAFKNLIPLPSDHFLARRFGSPDQLEKEGKNDPLGLIHLLLRDMGPKNAQEVKDELCELVIPEDEWSKWWQAARSKIKKDTKISSPKTTKDPFVLTDEGVPHETRFKEAFGKTKGIDSQIQIIYNYTRDFPEILKNRDLKDQLKSILLEGLSADKGLPDMGLARKIQASFLLEDIFPDEFPGAAASLITSINNLEEILRHIEIIAFKKRTLSAARENREDWISLFMRLLFTIPQNTLRDYIFKELQNDEQASPLLKEKIEELLNRVTIYPEAFFWYFQKLAAGEEIPYSDKRGKNLFFEAYMIVLHFIEDKNEHRDLVKKMYQFLTAKRYAVVRSMIEGTSIEYLKEFLLLASKCQIFSKQDLRIFQSLSEVVQPSLSDKKKGGEEEENVIWTTQEGYQRIQERVQHLGTVEMVEVAREIEAARALGDLRENSEYKFALEKRGRLQAELKMLSRQLNQARIVTREEISADSVGIGAVVQLKDTKGAKLSYTILGPWDADPEKHILSFQSKLAQAMTGLKKGESFDFQGEKFTVTEIKSFL